MLFFIVHHIIHHTPGMKDWAESKKNITTFLVGGLLYVFLLSFLQSEPYRLLIDSSFFLFTLKNWFVWIVMIDVTAMAVIYKNYWGRTILDELPETWATKRKKTVLPTIPEAIPEEPMTEEVVPQLTNEDTGREEYMPEGESNKPLGDAYDTTLHEEVPDTQSGA